MALTDSKAALAKASKDLLAKWEAIKATWSDAQTEAFESTYIGPLTQDVRNALGAMDQMDQFLQKIESDCE